MRDIGAIILEGGKMIMMSEKEIMTGGKETNDEWERN